MTFDEAIRILSTDDIGSVSDADWDNAIEVVEHAVVPLCKTPVDNGDGDTLGEWLRTAPWWSEDDTPESIAAEWDAALVSDVVVASKPEYDGE